MRIFKLREVFEWSYKVGDADTDFRVEIFKVKKSRLYRLKIYRSDMFRIQTTLPVEGENLVDLEFFYPDDVFCLPQLACFEADSMKAVKRFVLALLKQFAEVGHSGVRGLIYASLPDRSGHPTKLNFNQ